MKRKGVGGGGGPETRSSTTMTMTTTTTTTTTKRVEGGGSWATGRDGGRGGCGKGGWLEVEERGWEGNYEI